MTDQKDRLEELRQQISEAQAAQEKNPAPVRHSVSKMLEASVKVRIAQEYVINLIGGGIISYILGTVFSVAGHEDVVLMVTAIIMVTALLAATYRSWRIARGKDPNG